MGAQPSALQCRIRLRTADFCAKVRTSLKGAQQARSRTTTAEDVSSLTTRGLVKVPYGAGLISQMTFAK
ncbi:MAG: hypothetical protein QOF46_53 [Paraburkholderia sp.]|jgi:hypothetical protein|nr:hypothetical protein [Paraburkholderia sp.]